MHHLTLYTGRQEWAIGGSDAISGEEIDAYWDCVSRLSELLDLRRLPDPGGNDNLVVPLARLQRCEDPEALRQAAAPMHTWAADPAHAVLAAAFAAWISSVVLPDLGVSDVRTSDDLPEVLEMLERERVTWADRMRAEALVAMLLRLTRLRFGSILAERLARLLEGITDTDRLEVIGEWVVVSESGGALLAQVNES